MARLLPVSLQIGRAGRNHEGVTVGKHMPAVRVRYLGDYFREMPQRKVWPSDCR